MMYNQLNNGCSEVCILNFLEISLLSMPLCFVLLSLAFLPLIAPKFWHKREIVVLSLLTIVSIIFTLTFCFEHAKELFKNVLIDDYIPFIIMLFSLYFFSNGIHIEIKAHCGTVQNLFFLGLASVFSSIIGTTGAAMLFLRPFLNMNEKRKNKTHLVIFFIFLVANIGGLLTPLGDPPLLLGFLHGVDFEWFFINLFPFWAVYVLILLFILYVIDKRIFKKEKITKTITNNTVNIKGFPNIIFILLTVFILFIDIDFGLHFQLPYVCDCHVPHVCVKNIILLCLCLVSYLLTRKKTSHSIDFEPFIEVARTFLVIFIVITPVLFLLEENSKNIEGFIRNLSGANDVSLVYFWMCSFASSLLDNAPSYLLFFNMAGGDAKDLMQNYPLILKAISISSVVMGAMTYIGNAPNIMVRSIAEKKGIKMPSFLKYILWSCVIILPISLFISLFISK